jgi:hypothetical protein
MKKESIDQNSLLNDSLVHDQAFLKAIMVSKIEDVQGREESIKALRATYKSIARAGNVS